MTAVTWGGCRLTYSKAPMSRNGLLPKPVLGDVRVVDADEAQRVALAADRAVVVGPGAEAGPVRPLGSVEELGTHSSWKPKLPEPGRVTILRGSDGCRRSCRTRRRGRSRPGVSPERQRRGVGADAAGAVELLVDRREDGVARRERPDLAPGRVDRRRGRLELEVAVGRVDELAGRRRSAPTLPRKSPTLVFQITSARSRWSGRPALLPLLKNRLYWSWLKPFVADRGVPPSDEADGEVRRAGEDVVHRQHVDVRIRVRAR